MKRWLYEIKIKDFCCACEKIQNCFFSKLFFYITPSYLFFTHTVDIKEIIFSFLILVFNYFIYEILYFYNSPLILSSTGAHLILYYTFLLAQKLWSQKIAKKYLTNQSILRIYSVTIFAAFNQLFFFKLILVCVVCFNLIRKVNRLVDVYYINDMIGFSYIDAICVNVAPKFNTTKYIFK